MLHNQFLSLSVKMQLHGCQRRSCFWLSSSLSWNYVKFNKRIHLTYYTSFPLTQNAFAVLTPNWVDFSPHICIDRIMEMGKFPAKFNYIYFDVNKYWEECRVCTQTTLVILYARVCLLLWTNVLDILHFELRSRDCWKWNWNQTWFLLKMNIPFTWSPFLF